MHPLTRFIILVESRMRSAAVALWLLLLSA